MNVLHVERLERNGGAGWSPARLQNCMASIVTGNAEVHGVNSENRTCVHAKPVIRKRRQIRQNEVYELTLYSRKVGIL